MTTRQTETPSLDAFLAFLARANPRFECAPPALTHFEQMLINLEKGHESTVFAFNAARERSRLDDEELKAQWRKYAADERSRQRTTILLCHELALPPISSMRSELAEAVRGSSSTLCAFYASHDGAHLFGDDNDHGLVFLPISAMEFERTAIEDWFDGDDELIDPTTDEQGMITFYNLPDWFASSVVFGAIAVAAERFLLATEGPHRGAVFLFDHDPLGFVQVSRSFDGFLDALCADPGSAIGSHCGYHYISKFVSDAAQ